MYSVFEHIPLEVRQKAYDLFMSLPVDKGSPNHNRKAWRVLSDFEMNGDRGDYAVCPIGAVNFVAGQPKHILCELWDGLWAAGFAVTESEVEAFFTAWDYGEIDSLAEAMGVEDHADAQGL